MRILFLPNWSVQELDADSDQLQAPDKCVRGKPYWFFRHFPSEFRVDVLDIQKPNFLSLLEKRVNAYLWQGIKAFLRDREYDLVISHGAQSGLMYSLLRTLTFRRRPHHLIFDIGGMNGGRQNPVENAAIGFALSSRPYIVCHSKVVLDNYRDTYPQLLRRSRFVPFGVDTDDFQPQDDAPQGEYVLSFGASKRDYPTLLEAWSGVSREVQLRVIGHKAESNTSNVEFLQKVTIQELKDQIRGSLFVVIPLPVFNYSYGQMSFLQSMSLGKTVIVTKTPSSIDYLADGKGSYFVEPFDARDLREKIVFLLDNRHMLQESNRLAREHVLSHFSERLMAEEVLQYIASSFQLSV